jgi:methylase of polypeptide subunit release factors
MERGVDTSTADSLAGAWVRTGDYLFEASSFEADFVIGNPPYVRLEDIPAETAACTVRRSQPCGAALICTLRFSRRHWAS